MPRYRHRQPEEPRCGVQIEDGRVFGLADNEEGQQRLREANERKEHWLAGQFENEGKKTVLTETTVPADTEGGNAAMAADEVQNLEHAETSVRAAIIGGTKRQDT